MPYKLPEAWLPAAKMSRVIVHWTGGPYKVTDLDKSHYHFIIGGDLSVVRGIHTVKDNEVTGDGKYAAHTKGCNTGSIGVSIASMAGAQESPFKAGPFPLMETQWARAAEVVAQLCAFYKIPITSKTVLTHAEVQPNLGIAQRQKWDVTRLPFDPKTVGAKACGDKFRSFVKTLSTS